MNVYQFLQKTMLAFALFLLSHEAMCQTVTTITACNSFTWPSNGQTYTVTTVDAHYVNSVITDSLYLTIVNSKTSSFTQSICSNQSYTWNGIAQTTTGNYLDTFATSFGCDSIVTLQLIVNPTPFMYVVTNNEGGTCAGAAVNLYAYGCTNYTWNGTAGTGSDTTFAPAVANNYTVVGTDANGCTASTTFNVVVNAIAQELSLASTNNVASIIGETYMYQNQPDASSLLYFDDGCHLIAKISDSLGGSILGLTMAKVTIDTGVKTHNNQPYLRRHYYIEPTTQGGANVTLYLTQADFDDYNSNNGSWLDLPTGLTDLIGMSHLRITKLNGGDLGIGTPEVITPALTWNAIKNYWEASFHVNGFSHFYFHSVNPGNAPLPISLFSFMVRKEDQSNVLSWATSSEQNNDYFKVQRSANAKDFVTIGEVNSKAKNGNSNTELHYIFSDLRSSIGALGDAIYYRLQQVDIDGITTHSKIIKLSNYQIRTFDAYPNPATSVLNINLTSDTESYTESYPESFLSGQASNSRHLTTIKLLDLTGQVIKQLEIQASKGTNQITMNIEDVALGFYSLQIVHNNKLLELQKIIKY
jgi:Secretion system C-terminal sorting domain